jgi:hypothetical protein
MAKHFVIMKHDKHFGIVWRGHSAGAGLDVQSIVDVIAYVLREAGASVEVLDESASVDVGAVVGRILKEKP